MIDELGTMWKKTYWPFRWLISLREKLSLIELLNMLVYGFVADAEYKKNHGNLFIVLYLLRSRPKGNGIAYIRAAYCAQASKLFRLTFYMYPCNSQKSLVW